MTKRRKRRSLCNAAVQWWRRAPQESAVIEVRYTIEFPKEGRVTGMR